MVSNGDSWSLSGSSCRPGVTVEILSKDDERLLSIETATWSFSFDIQENSIVNAADALRRRRENDGFAELEIGTFLGQQVRLFCDDEFNDRIWLRISNCGNLVDFAIAGSIYAEFVFAITEACVEAGWQVN